MIDRQIEKLAAQLRGLCEIVTEIEVGDDSRASAKGLGDHELELDILRSFGFAARPKDGAVGVALKIGFKGATALLLCYRDPAGEPTLEKGESAQYGSEGGEVRCNKDGEVVVTPKAGKKAYLGGKTGSEPAAKATSLETRITAIETFLGAHVHSGGTVSGNTGGPNGSPPSGGDFAASNAEVS